MAEETFHVVHGQMVFATAQRRNQLQTQLQNRVLNKPTFRGDVLTLFREDSGKYGGPALVCTLRFVNRADADDIWALARTELDAGTFVSFTVLFEASVTSDVIVGTSSTTIVHRVHIPAAIDDIP